MLAKQHRHPADLQSVTLLCYKLRTIDSNHYEFQAEGHPRPVLVPIQYTEVEHVGDDTYVSMPRWLAKNKELLADNTHLPVEHDFP